MSGSIPWRSGKVRSLQIPEHYSAEQGGKTIHPHINYTRLAAEMMPHMCRFRLDTILPKLSNVQLMQNKMTPASLVLFSIHRKHKNKPHRQKPTWTASESVNAVIRSHSQSFPRRSLSPLELPGAVSGDLNSRFKTSW